MLGKNCSIQIPPDKHVRKSLVKQIPPDDLNRGDNINQVHIFPSFIFIFAIVVLLPPSRNLDPGSHSKRLFPLPTTVRAFRFYREKDSAFSSLVDSRRIVPTHTIIGALDSWCHLRIKNTIRRFEPMTSTLVVYLSLIHI